MALTYQEKSLIKSSFSQLKDRQVNLAQSFYSCLFELAPLIEPMFKKDLLIQEMHFNELLRNLVEDIDQFEQLEQRLFLLGKKHSEFGVETIQFDVVKTALLLSIQNALKGLCTEAVKSAWSKYYDEISKIMIRGLNHSN